MKRLREFLFNHWRAKLFSLALAVLSWLVIRHAVVSSPAEPAPAFLSTPHAAP